MPTRIGGLPAATCRAIAVSTMITGLLLLLRQSPAGRPAGAGHRRASSPPGGRRAGARAGRWCRSGSGSRGSRRRSSRRRRGSSMPKHLAVAVDDPGRGVVAHPGGAHLVPAVQALLGRGRPDRGLGEQRCRRAAPGPRRGRRGGRRRPASSSWMVRSSTGSVCQSRRMRRRPRGSRSSASVTRLSGLRPGSLLTTTRPQGFASGSRLASQSSTPPRSHCSASPATASTSRSPKGRAHWAVRASSLGSDSGLRW